MATTNTRFSAPEADNGSPWRLVTFHPTPCLPARLPRASPSLSDALHTMAPSQSVKCSHPTAAATSPMAARSWPTRSSRFTFRTNAGLLTAQAALMYLIVELCIQDASQICALIIELNSPLFRSPNDTSSAIMYLTYCCQSHYFRTFDESQKQQTVLTSLRLYKLLLKCY